VFPSSRRRISTFSETQIVGILNDPESGVSGVKRLRDRSENAKLKRMYADLALEYGAIKMS
jgi:hypothetical protein